MNRSDLAPHQLATPNCLERQLQRDGTCSHSREQKVAHNRIPTSNSKQITRYYEQADFVDANKPTKAATNLTANKLVSNYQRNYQPGGSSRLTTLINIVDQHFTDSDPATTKIHSHTKASRIVLYCTFRPYSSTLSPVRTASST